MGLGQRVFVCRKGIYRVSGTVAFSYASLLVCLFFLLLTQAVFAKVPAPLTLAYLSSGKSGGERMHWQVFARVLSKNTHLNIQVRAFDKPDALAKSIKNRQIQLAILGNSATLEVIEQTQGAATIFAQIKPPLSVDGHRTEGNHALIIAHKESEIQGLDDVLAEPGKYSFQTAEPRSIAATWVPLYYAFEKEGRIPAVLFKTLGQGTQESNLLAVARKEVDLATVSSQIFEGSLKEIFPHEYNSVKIIWASELIQGEAVIYAHHLPVKVKKTLEKAFFTFGKTAEEREVLSALRPASGFAPSSNRQLAQISDIQQFEALQRLSGNNAISEAEKLALKTTILGHYRKLRQQYIK